MIRRAAILFLSTVIVGCSSRSPQPEPVVVPKYITHKVRYSGETLGTIAQWYTGSSRNWSQIKDANPGLRPERIRLGDVIQIPEDLVVKREPLPSTAIKKAVVEAPKSEEQEGAIAQPTVQDAEQSETEATENAVTETEKAATEEGVQAEAVAGEVVETVPQSEEAAPSVPATEPVVEPAPPAAGTLGELDSFDPGPKATGDFNTEKEQLLRELLTE